jgi:hypothetical protein
VLYDTQAEHDVELLGAEGEVPYVGLGDSMPRTDWTTDPVGIDRAAEINGRYIGPAGEQDFGEPPRPAAALQDMFPG